MKIHFSRDGKQFGPYPVEQIDDLLRAGTVMLTDHVWYPGASGWIFLSAFLASRQPSAAANPASGASKPATIPPPLPAMPPVISQATPASGISPQVGPSVTNAELEREILAGGRFVIFTFCVSVGIMSFKRPSEIIYLKPGESGFGRAFAYSLISLFAGWWGIPWGPIWTVSTLFSNAHGGKDVTLEVLSTKLGGPRASALLMQRGKLPAPGGMLRAWRYALWIGLGLILANIALIGFMALRNPGSNPQESAYSSKNPGKAAFEAANRLIDFNHGQAAFGNTSKARDLAQLVSSKMKQLDESEFSGGKKNGFSASKHEFMTYCDLRSNQCIVLVHVPELRRYDKEAKDAVCELTWRTAQEALRSTRTGQAGFVLAVGVRGMALYERLMAGEYVADYASDKTGIVATQQGFQAKEELYPFFDEASNATFGLAAKVLKKSEKPAAER